VTTATGGGENNINLAAMFIPLMPETKGLMERMAVAGKEGGAIAGTEAGNTFNITFKAASAKSVEESRALGGKMGQGLLEGLQRSGVGARMNEYFGGFKLSTFGAAAGITALVVALEKLGKGIVDAGVEFEDINRQIDLFTNASGANLDDMKDHVDRLVGSLDTGTKNLGTDFAMLSQRLHVSGDELDTVTRHVEELRDRFGELNTSNFAGAMLQFSVAGKDADDTLASLTQSSRQFGVNLGKVVDDVAEAGPALRELGLNAQQAGYMMAEMESMGLGGAAGPQMLARAEKANVQLNDKLGLHRTIGEFIQQENAAIQQLGDSGNEAAAQEEAFFAYGVRNWPLAIKASQAYADTLKKTPEELRASGGDIDSLSDKTQTLHNKWEHLFNQLKEVANYDLGGGSLVKGLKDMADGLDEALYKFGLLEPHFGPAGQSVTATTGGFQMPGTPGGPPARGGQQAPLAPDNPKARRWVPDATSPGGGSFVQGPAAPAAPGAAAPSGNTGGVPLVQNPDGTWTSSNPAWAHLISRESSGNPVNVQHGFVDANTGGNEAQGLFQITPATWKAHGGTEFAPTPNQASPQQQAIVAARILKANPSGSDWGAGLNGREDPSALLAGISGPPMHAGGDVAGGGDAVPITAHAGEFVVNKKAYDMFGPFVRWMNAQGNKGVNGPAPRGFGRGGDVGGVSQVIWSDLEDPSVQAAGGDAGYGVLYGKVVSGGPGSPYSDETNPSGQGFAGHHGHVHTTFNSNPFTGEKYGIADQNTTLGDWSAFPPWVHQLGDMYGLDAKTYTGHQVWDGANHGIDWYPRGKQDMSGKSYTHADNVMLSNFASDAGAVGTAQLAGFHTTSGAPIPQSPSGIGGPGGSPGGPSMPSPFSWGGKSKGGGAPNPSKVDATQTQRNKGLRDAGEAVEDETEAVAKYTDDLHKADAAIVAATEAQMNARPGTDDLAKANDALAKAQKDHAEAYKGLKRANERLGDAQDNLRIAGDKENEPIGGKGGGGSAESFGSGLLKGLFDEIGLPGAKSILDWPTFKLGMGILNWGLSGMKPGQGQGSPFQGGAPGAAGSLSGGPGLPGLPGWKSGAPGAGANAPGGFNSLYIDQSLNVAHHGPQMDTNDLQAMHNGMKAAQATVNTPGALPAQ
jgi:hypothetical protein